MNKNVWGLTLMSSLLPLTAISADIRSDVGKSLEANYSDSELQYNVESNEFDHDKIASENKKMLSLKKAADDFMASIDLCDSRYAQCYYIGDYENYKIIKVHLGERYVYSPEYHKAMYSTVRLEYKNNAEDLSAHYINYGKLYNYTGLKKEYNDFLKDYISGISRFDKATYDLKYNPMSFIIKLASGQDIPDEIVLEGECAGDNCLNQDYSSWDLGFNDANLENSQQSYFKKINQSCFGDYAPDWSFLIAPLASALYPTGNNPLPFKTLFEASVDVNTKLNSKLHPYCYESVLFFNTFGTGVPSAGNIIDNLWHDNQNRFDPTKGIAIVEADQANVIDINGNYHVPVYGQVNVESNSNSLMPEKGFYLYTTKQYSVGNEVMTNYLIPSNYGNGSLGSIENKPLGNVQVQDYLSLLDHQSLLLVQDFGFGYWDYGQVSISNMASGHIHNPHTPYPDYMIFEDGLYWYHTQGIGRCDFVNDKVFCNDFDHQYHWVTTEASDIVDNQSRIVDTVNLSANRIIFSADQWDNKLVEAEKNNRILLFDINGIPLTYYNKNLTRHLSHVEDWWSREPWIYIYNDTDFALKYQTISTNIGKTPRSDDFDVSKSNSFYSGSGIIIPAGASLVLELPLVQSYPNALLPRDIYLHEVYGFYNAQNEHIEAIVDTTFSVMGHRPNNISKYNSKNVTVSVPERNVRKQNVRKIRIKNA